MSLVDELGDIDIYVFDQILRGRIGPGDRVLDAGCGSGRNLVYLLRAGVDVSAVDRNGVAVSEVRQLAASLAPSLSGESVPRGSG
jgi:SAM-dependent methyltransferase